MFKDAFDLKTTVVPDNASLLVTRLGRRTTIHHLPVEILTEILVQCITPLVPAVCKLPLLEIYPFEIQETLSDVCRLWCTIIDREPRAWATLTLDYKCPDAEAFSLSLKKAKSCPLDVYIDIEYRNGPDMLPAITELVYSELPRIRSLFASEHFMNIFSTFPTIRDGHTVLRLPRMESLNLINLTDCKDWKARFSFPQLDTLVLRDFRVSIDGSMPSVRHLDMAEYVPRYTQNGKDVCWSSQLLQIMPNLVSLIWSIEVSHEPLERPVVLPSLTSLSLPSYGKFQSETLCALQCFLAPSLESLELDLGISTTPLGHELTLMQALDVICRKGSVQLRRLTLCCSPKSVNCRAIPVHLDHLETCTILASVQEKDEVCECECECDGLADDSDDSDDSNAGVAEDGSML